MKLENELRQLFIERYLEHLLQFLKEDEDYQLIQDEIILAQEETREALTQADKEKLKKLKYQLAEYVHVKIFEMGFLEGLYYRQSS